ncbi:hypothetical protein DFJ73DRAFT_768514 [Zopfochytrium polystomum]|nr:hypothetical protein DFJ73DRAFT_768514 [Zopfochytrium polystomum]
MCGGPLRGTSSFASYYVNDPDTSSVPQTSQGGQLTRDPNFALAAASPESLVSAWRVNLTTTTAASITTTISSIPFVPSFVAHGSDGTTSTFEQILNFNIAIPITLGLLGGILLTTLVAVIACLHRRRRERRRNNRNQQDNHREDDDQHQSHAKNQPRTADGTRGAAEATTGSPPTSPTHYSSSSHLIPLESTTPHPYATVSTAFSTRHFSQQQQLSSPSPPYPALPAPTVPHQTLLQPPAPLRYGSGGGSGDPHRPEIDGRFWAGADGTLPTGAAAAAGRPDRRGRPASTALFLVGFRHTDQGEVVGRGANAERRESANSSWLRRPEIVDAAGEELEEGVPTSGAARVAAARCFCGVGRRGRIRRGSGGARGGSSASGFCGQAHRGGRGRVRQSQRRFGRGAAAARCTRGLFF